MNKSRYISSKYIHDQEGETDKEAASLLRILLKEDYQIKQQDYRWFEGHGSKSNREQELEIGLVGASGGFRGGRAGSAPSPWATDRRRHGTPRSRCNPRPVATGRVSCVCDWSRDATGLGFATRP